MTFYVADSKPIFDYNWFDEHYIVKSDKPLPAGEDMLKLDFNYDGEGAGKGGTASIFINNEKVAEGRIEKTVAGRFGIDTFGIGADTGAPVTFDYAPPFAFNGKIE
jgi:hypothetical protein